MPQMWSWRLLNSISTGGRRLINWSGSNGKATLPGNLKRTILCLNYPLTGFPISLQTRRVFPKSIVANLVEYKRLRTTRLLFPPSNMAYEHCNNDSLSLYVSQSFRDDVARGENMQCHGHARTTFYHLQFER